MAMNKHLQSNIELDGALAQITDLQQEVYNLQIELAGTVAQKDAEIAELKAYIDYSLSNDKNALMAEISKFRHENLILKAHYCLERISGNIDKIMLDSLQEKRDLEQQAKVLEDAHKCIVKHEMFRCARDYIKQRASELRQQAKALEGEK